MNEHRPHPFAHGASPLVADSFKPRALALAIRAAVAGSGMLLATAAVAGPAGEAIVGGSGAVSRPNALTTVVSQQSHNLAIDWQSFDVNAAETVRFDQPSASATALNRVLGQAPSAIYGRLQANGRVVLANPNGVLFGPGSQVQVNSLVAAGLTADVASFMAGKLDLQALPGTAGTVINQGSIEAATGGSVVLTGRAVSNQGLIIAQRGQVTLAAGDQATVDFEGDGLLQIAVGEAVDENPSGSEAAVVNDGVIDAGGGQVLMTAHAARDVFSRIVVNNGAVTAGRIDNSGGVIRLVAAGEDGSVENTGTLDASSAGADDGGVVELAASDVVQNGLVSANAASGAAGSVVLSGDDATTLGEGSETSASSAGGRGGKVVVQGAAVALNYDARVDASGASGGGEILVGGDVHGANPAVRNAETTFVSSQATLAADASVEGDGGKVVVWADDTTQYYGTATAKGGASGGDGGFVEVSGKDTLVMRGDVDVTAPAGETGTLLLDPATLNIIDAAAGGDHDGGLPTIAEGAADIGGNTVSWGQIRAQGALANIVLEATGLVTIEDVTGAAGGAITSADLVTLDLTTGSLTISSNSGNVFFQDQGDRIQTQGGRVIINATLGLGTLGHFESNGGDVTFNVGGGAFGNVDTGGGVLTLNNTGAGSDFAQSGSITGNTIVVNQGAGTVILDGSNNYTGTTTVTNGILALQGGAAIADAGVVTVTSGTLRIDASETFGTLNSSGGSSTVLNGGAVVLTVGGGTVAGAVSGAGALTKNGGGTLRLTADNSYSGTTTINAGLVRIESDDALGTTANGTTVANGAALELQGGIAVGAEALSLTGAGIGGNGALRNVSGDNSFAGAVTLTGATTIQSDANTLTLSGGITGATQNLTVEGAGNTTVTGVIGTTSGTLTKNDGGTLRLTNDNTYAGATTINGGVVRIESDDALGAPAGAGTTVATGAMLEVSNGITVSADEALSLAGTGVGENGALRNVSGDNSFAGAVTLTGATTIQSDANTLTLSGGITGAPQNLTVEGAGDTTISGNITTTTGTLTKNDGGTLLLSGTNTFTG
ncbi:MAG: filamentous hemagglutinin N-terminal domain-containing protein, partial [Gammaproteobacteria bacterium]|nr:filamentous hemagglutinin N-terminal domain-containing protein [Gammaproteobacteria bacterium]